jgi:hypothetical protein
MKNTNEPRTLTQAQIDANRENAKKSTGPRTAEGKAASSRNRLVHGLRANKHILIGRRPIPKISSCSSKTSTLPSAPSAKAKKCWSRASPPINGASTAPSPWKPVSYRQRLEAVAAEDYLPQTGIDQS